MNDTPFKELALRCAMCGRLFSAGISPNDPDLERTDLPARVHDCPHCGFTSAYSKGEYIFPKE